MTKDWEGVKSAILDLYQTQRKTLAETMLIMKEDYGFMASYVRLTRDFASSPLTLY